MWPFSFCIPVHPWSCLHTLATLPHGLNYTIRREYLYCAKAQKRARLSQGSLGPFIDLWCRCQFLILFNQPLRWGGGGDCVCVTWYETSWFTWEEPCDPFFRGKGESMGMVAAVGCVSTCLPPESRTVSEPGKVHAWQRGCGQGCMCSLQLCMASWKGVGSFLGWCVCVFVFVCMALAHFSLIPFIAWLPGLGWGGDFQDYRHSAEYQCPEPWRIASLSECSGVCR